MGIPIYPFTIGDFAKKSKADSDSAANQILQTETCLDFALANVPYCSGCG